jgi:hypothetical protein
VAVERRLIFGDVAELYDRSRPTYPAALADDLIALVRPEARYTRARAALAAGGVLAAFWNRPLWSRVELRASLAELYARIAPGADIDGPMHPGGPDLPEQRDEWDEQAALAAGLGEAEVRTYEWALDYSSAEYADLLGTLADHRLLTERTRRMLLEAVADAIESGAGRLRMAYVTRLRLARAV